MELVEKTQQLNLLRESNTTLRADSKAHATQSCDLRLVYCWSLILCVRAHTIQAELEAHSEHIMWLEEENRWNNQLLTKVCLSIHFVGVGDADGHCAAAVQFCGSLGLWCCLGGTCQVLVLYQVCHWW